MTTYEWKIPVMPRMNSIECSGTLNSLYAPIAHKTNLLLGSSNVKYLGIEQTLDVIWSVPEEHFPIEYRFPSKVSKWIVEWMGGIRLHHWPKLLVDNSRRANLPLLTRREKG